jgi:hypothetical protein
VQKIANKHAGGVAKGFVRRGAASAQGGCVHDIVVQQCGGVDQFHNGREAVPMCAPIPQGAADHQQQCRSQAFSASGNDVLRYLGHQRDAGRQALTNDLVDLVHVLCNEQERGCCGGGVVSQDGGHRKRPDYRKPRRRFVATIEAAMLSLKAGVVCCMAMRYTLGLCGNSSAELISRGQHVRGHKNRRQAVSRCFRRKN